ncbi:MAG: tyrosine--tRNA ligase [Patescibacteria group bacterium]
MKADKKKIEELLTRGVAEVIGRDDLERALLTGKKLRVKLGIDPTSPNLHIGRGVVLLKLRDFQELGHLVVFIVGDFTGEIGDTSDKDTERPKLSTDQVKQNMNTYLDQAGKILDMNKVEVHYNSEWLENPGYREILRQADVFSLAPFINRENIKKRLDEGGRISLREVFYPLMQGYDSVMVKADVELGGTDQRFNLLAGRDLQKDYGQKPQSIIMTNLILGTDGRKMSSSWGNTINLMDSAQDMHGKVMTIPDAVIVSYFTHCTRMPLSQIEKIKKELTEDANPRDAKMRLAREIVTLYHGADAAQASEEHFISLFRKHETPADIPELKLRQGLTIVEILVAAGFAASKSDARRLVKQGGVTWDEEPISSETFVPALTHEGAVLKKGKRFFTKIQLR